MGWSWRRVVLMGAVGIAAISIGYRVSQAPEETKAAALPLPLANRGMPDPEAEIRALQDRVGANPNAADRSEEHTSELQSLMRISYAVFCLKKKKKNLNNINDY